MGTTVWYLVNWSTPSRIAELAHRSEHPPMWNLFYRNTHLLILTVCLIVVLGVSSYLTLPRLEDPILTQRAAVIETRLPGASANRVESLVTDKIEQELFEIDEIKEIESISRTGLSTVIVRLDEQVNQVDQVWSQVRDRLADVSIQLPADASVPDYEELEAKAFAMIVALTWETDAPLSDAVLSRTSEALSDQFRLIPGTERVELIGEPKEEIVVEANAADLAALGLTTQDLTQQIQASDAKVAAGKLRHPRNELLIEPTTELASLEQVRSIPIRFGSTGQFTYLGDIAQVRRGIVEPPESIALINGRPAIALAALIKPHQRIDRWAEQTHQVLDTFAASLPNGIGVQTIFDQSKYVETRINGLFANLIIGVLLVVISTVVMMGWRPALIVGFSLPLSIWVVFGIMSLFGIPLHQMSVTGLVMALGLLIDNAIVVVDELHQDLTRGLAPKAAITKTVRYLTVPLLASTLTTVFTFMPNALMTGNIGEFIRTVGISVILALLSSLFLSLTVIPALYGRFYRAIATPAQPGSFSAILATGFSHPRLTRAYQSSLDRIIFQPHIGILLSLVIPMAGFAVALTFDHQLFPPAERDQIHIEVELQPQAALSQSQSTVQQVQQQVLAHPGVEQIYWFIGENAPAIYYNFPKVRRNSANYAHAIVQLKLPAQPDLLQALQAELNAAFPAAHVLVRQLEQGPVAGAPIQIRLYGPNLEVLRSLGNSIRAELSHIPQVNYHRASLSNTQPTLGLQLDEEQTQLAGLDNTTVTQQLSALIEGTVGGSIIEDTEELPIRVRLTNERRGNLDDISSIEVLPERTASGDARSPVPLSGIGRIELIPQLSDISRRNGQRVNTIEAFVEVGVLPSTVLSEFRQRLEASTFQLPDGYLLEFGGEFSERNDAIANLFATAPIFLVLMVASLVLSFGSFQLAGIIVLIALCSVGLAFMSLWVFDFPLGFMAILGTAGLVGLAINDSIVVLAALRAEPSARRGNVLAIRQVIVRSTRHVLTTTITTIVGFIPLLVNGGQFWAPLAIAIVGGVGGATLLALFFVPCIYLIWIRRCKRASAPFQ
ncbi:MAG: efflux RND transporter permease subunit [Elainellaceae cyanobacterium]